MMPMQRKIRAFLEKNSLDCAIIRNFRFSRDPNFYYFSSLPPESFPESFLVLRKKMRPVVIASCLEEQKKGNWFELRIVSGRKGFSETLKECIKGKKIGVNFQVYPHSNFPGLKKLFKGKKILDISFALGKAREIKSREEIKKIEGACKITEKALNSIPDFFRKGMKEKELALELEFMARRLGAEGLSFPAIVAFGNNASVPHHITSKKKISGNGLLIVDFGVKYENYCSDLSRTFCVGKPGEKQAAAYSAVREIQENAFKNLKQGANASSLFNEADRQMKQFFSSGLMHALGHGLGMEVHDFPDRLGPKSAFKLKKGMVFTLEPAYYKKGFGGVRIEDCFAVEKKSSKRLSKAPKGLAGL